MGCNVDGKKRPHESAPAHPIIQFVQYITTATGSYHAMHQPKTTVPHVHNHSDTVLSSYIGPLNNDCYFGPLLLTVILALFYSLLYWPSNNDRYAGHLIMNDILAFF